MEDIQEAIRILKAARMSVAFGSAAVWLKLDHAITYLNKQMIKLLAE